MDCSMIRVGLRAGSINSLEHLANKKAMFAFGVDPSIIKLVATGVQG
jgi:hypothetical protein